MMNKYQFKFTITLFLILHLYCSSLFAEDPKTSCPYNVLQIITDRSMGKEFSVSATTGKEIFRLGKEKNKEALYLGISGDGHYYLLIGKDRIDGDILTSKAQITELGANSDGYLIRFPSISKETILKINNLFLKSENNNLTHYSLSCVQTACSLLAENFDIKIAGESWAPHIHPSLTLKKILKHGFVNSKNEEIPIEIIKTSRRIPELNEFAANLKSKDRAINTFLVFMTFGSGGGLAYILDKSKE